MSQTRRRLATLALCIILVGAWLFLAISSASSVNIRLQETNLPLSWDFFALGVNDVGANGTLANAGTALHLGSIVNGSSSRGTWDFNVPPDLIGRNETVSLYISGLPFASEANGFITVQFNDEKINFGLTRPELMSFGLVYTVSEAPLPTVQGFSGNFMNLTLGAASLSEHSVVSITLPPLVEWYVEKLVLEVKLAPTHAENSYLGIEGPLILASASLTIIAVVGYWIISHRNRLRPLGLVMLAILVRVLIASFTTHVYDDSVYRQYIYMFFHYSDPNLGYWVYGPLWLIGIFAAISPYYLVNSALSNLFVTNLLLKLVPIVADVGVYCLILSRSKRSEGSLSSPTTLWLFNPLVIYVSSVMGYWASPLGFLILFALTTRGVAVKGIVTGLAAGILPLSAILVFPFSFIHSTWRRTGRFLASAAGTIVITVLLPYLLLEGDPLYLISQYGRFQITHEIGAFSWLDIISQQFPGFNSPLTFTLALVLIAAAVSGLVVKNLKELELPLVLLALSSLFFMTYAQFYPQQFIWILPVFILWQTQGANPKGGRMILAASIAMLLSYVFFDSNFFPNILLLNPGIGNTLSLLMVRATAYFFPFLYTLPLLYFAFIISPVEVLIWRILSLRGVRDFRIRFIGRVYGLSFRFPLALGALGLGTLDVLYSWSEHFFTLGVFAALIASTALLLSLPWTTKGFVLGVVILQVGAASEAYFSRYGVVSDSLLVVSMAVVLLTLVYESFRIARDFLDVKEPVHSGSSSSSYGGT